MKKQLNYEKNASRSLKIGFVFDDSLDRSDGVAQYVKQLGSWLSSRRHEVRYLTGETKMSEWKGGKIYSLSKNKQVTFNGNKLTTPLPASKKKIRQVLEEEKFDVLHVQVPYSPFMAQRVINESDPKTAIIGTFHIMPAGSLASSGLNALKPIYGSSLKRFDKFFSVSSAAKDFASKSLKINSDISPNVIELDKFRTNKQKKASKPKIVFLGRLVKRKGCLELLKAFKVFSEKNDSKLIIAGDGPERSKLETYVQKNNLSERVEFLGFIDEESKAPLLASADIAVFPALYGESFGIVLIEGMASGSRVVLGGDNPGYRSVLEDQPKLLVNPKDTKEFALRLEELLKDSALTRSLFKWQTSHVKQFDVNIVGAKMVEEYHSAIDKRARSGHN